MPTGKKLQYANPHAKGSGSAKSPPKFENPGCRGRMSGPDKAFNGAKRSPATRRY